ncbi:MAG: ferritin family protein [Candidatus Zixiibacteriota bacterium]
MDVYEHAMKMEQDGRAFYLEQAGKTAEPALKRILQELANDELKHYNLFRAMRDRESADYKDAEKTTIITTAKNVFEELSERGGTIAFSNDVRKLWEFACEVEKKSETFYREKAGEMNDESQKRIWNRIADEEHRHWNTIELVIQFLERPKQWLADAEWNTLED